MAPRIFGEKHTPRQRARGRSAPPPPPPQVEVVATISPAMLPCTLAQPRRGGRTCRPLQLQGTDHRRLQKAALRSCTDALVSSGAFRFRRSAFRGQAARGGLRKTRPRGAAPPGRAGVQRRPSGARVAAPQRPERRFSGVLAVPQRHRNGAIIKA